MMYHITLGSITIVCCLVFVVYRAVRYCYSTPRLFPPGPPPDPFIGNLRQLPSDYQEKTFGQWSKIYGDVSYAQVFGKSLVVLNSPQAARDLLEKRSLNYSDRPRFVLLSELMGWDAMITHMSYGDQFRKHRRLIQEQFHRTAIGAFRPLQEQEAYILLQGLLITPDLFLQHIRRFAASSILKIAYGHTVKFADDPLVRTVEEVATASIEEGSPGSTLVDIIPALKHLPTWMPGAGFKRRALNIRERVHQMLDAPYLDVKRQLESGAALPSIAASLLEHHEANGNLTPENEEYIKAVTGVLYSAASDTTACVLATFILAMVLYPDVYRKAQEEINRIVGADRLPTLEDRDSLPYVQCILMEVYRWNAAVPLCIPHSSVEDDLYRGYHIPGGAMMIPNIWAMTQIEEVYPQPQIFRPERFLGPNGQLDRTHEPEFVFGFGRRICPGKDFADVNLWLAITGIIATVDISRSLDGKGREIIPPASFISGFVSHPKPFTCNIRPRSTAIPEIVLRTNVDTDL